MSGPGEEEEEEEGEERATTVALIDGGDDDDDNGDDARVARRALADEPGASPAGEIAAAILLPLFAFGEEAPRQRERTNFIVLVFDVGFAGNAEQCNKSSLLMLHSFF